MVIAISLAWLSSTSSWSILGYTLLAIGIIATLLSPHRYLLGYLLAGMFYGWLVSGIHSVILAMSSLDNWQAYVCALAITWMPLAIWFLYQINKADSQSDIEASTQPDTYIEHTPIYKNYQPRFHNSEQLHPKYK